MKMKMKFSLIVCCVCALLATGCSDSDGPGEGGGGGGGTSLTPTQQKQKMESIGTEFINKINADDQKQLVNLLDYFLSEYVDFGSEDDESGGGYEPAPEYVSETVKKITSILNGEMYALAELGAPESEIYQLSDYYGIYTPDKTTKEWMYTEALDRLEINFKNETNQTCFFKLTESGNKHPFVMEGQTVNIPEKLLLQISENGIQLAQVELYPSFSATSSGLTAVSVRSLLETYGNNIKYRWGSQTTLSQTEASLSYSLAKQSETLSTSSLTLRGTNLIDWVTSGNSLDGIAENLSKAELTIDILGKLQLKGNCTDIATLIQIDDEMDDSEASVRAAAAQVNSLLAINLFYDNSSTVQAKCILDPVSGEYNGYEYVNGEWRPQTYTEWYLEPVIQFTSDDSKYSFDTYFDQSGFGDLINRLNDLGDSFKNLFR